MSAGKGDAPRPVKGDDYRNNYDKIFGRNIDNSLLKKWSENILPNDSINVIRPKSSNRK